MDDPTPMTRAERTELASVVRMRARVAKAEVDANKAKLLADFEEQVATEYEMRDERWTAYIVKGEAAVAEANEAILRAFEESGIPEAFAPRAGLIWQARGNEWVLKGRRDELRNVAAKRLDAQAKAAKVEIDRAEVELRAELVAAGLSSGEASAWLERLPSVDQLMPRLRLVEIEAYLDKEQPRYRRALGM